MDQKTNVVCKTCNETWMSDIESAARLTLSNMIRDGASVTLLTPGIVSLATFAFKCAVIGNHMSPDGPPFFSPGVRRKFRETLRIPDGVQIWVAAFQGLYRFSGRCAPYYAKATADPLLDLRFYIFTFAVGHLAFQVLAPKWAKLYSQRPTRLLTDDFRPWDRAATRIFPYDGFPVSWPPALYLDDDGFDTFKHRWRRIKVAFR